MALVWGAVCSDCLLLAVENCPHCTKDYCEKCSVKHSCENLRSREFAVAG